MKISMAAKMALRTMINLTIKKPLCVSFEVTHSCPADCRHCDKGKIKKETGVMVPDDYLRRSLELLPAACQLSGGEPLLRNDLEDVARAIKRPSGLPFLVCVTNGWLFSEKRYLSLIEAGVNMFSVSLDFPDERHDDFRQLDGLYKKLDKLIPKLAKHKLNNIAINSALTRANFAEIPKLVKKAEKWGVKISFSAYSVLRTGDSQYCISDKNDQKLLKQNIDFLLEHKKHSGTVLNSNYILKNTLRFFQNGGHFPGCRASLRFLCIRPDNLINPCSMHPKSQYQTQEEAVQKFDVRHSCSDCYVAIRALTERPLRRLIMDGVGVFSQIK